MYLPGSQVGADDCIECPKVGASELRLNSGLEADAVALLSVAMQTLHKVDISIVVQDLCSITVMDHACFGLTVG